MSVHHGVLLLALCLPVQAALPTFEIERLAPSPGATGSPRVSPRALLPVGSRRFSALIALAGGGASSDGVAPPTARGETKVLCGAAQARGKSEDCIVPPDDGRDDLPDGELSLKPRPKETRDAPRRDRDGDGTEDDDDTCPDQVGPVANHGCPMRDLDGDGIDDDLDECPDEKGPPERKGCPDPDLDKDGVLNRVDSCILDPGTPENLGCPPYELPLVELKSNALALRQKVYFKPGTAGIDPRSFELLDWVARVMNEHLEQLPRMVIGVHVDDRGDAKQSRRLTQARAEKVRQYLVDHEVAPERLQAKGYGPDRPLDSNDTSLGRENNRRVEFTLQSQDFH